MTTQATLGDNTFTLERFPLDQKNRSLQAWDSADEYLIDYVNEHYPDCRSLLILNDSFGALSCYFSKQQLTVCSVNDSYISHQAAAYNLAQNKIATTAFSQLDSLSALPEQVDLVLVKVPRTLAFLQYQLSELSEVLAPGTPVIGAAKTKDVHNSTIKAFEDFIGETKTSLAVKKSRLIISQAAGGYKGADFPVSWPLEGTDFTISNHANVFSRDSLDIGARFFFNYLPQTNKAKNIIDLGCGNGVVGLMTLARCPNAHISFVDESYMAVESARLNIELNMEDKFEQCTFIENDCLTDFERESADIVLCNPPFHQAQAVTDHIAWQMFKQAKDTLKEGGELRIIGNRHLDYHDKLNRMFGNCTLLGSNKKFVVLSATKNSGTL
ncbi:MAG: 23S rRNA (guanine1835-N2)-methyltransferase [Pseudoalteromonas tetraodonis]|jgi:23S rRNA (guanine1835-N2)-methyltransferase|uniref:Ribosomal RNA large subunit methyltransferase G n=1 Tax=Pseudoalteromonas issachenkonii TaxID=152297 RepID=A0ABN5BYR8_9GAMM|nr:MULTISPECIES: methyltransferase [Pseudoalteromonas]PHQ88886.1 MAG: 23S rRNA (guanine(1835)-N(2))-methyltransferase [Pseudoalteromonas sp.]ADT67789.1 ribosomal RNA small subunit methyltransferase D [Pseudoalteromonas sp. SM9913]ALQ54139.1 Ribosomal RNA large subunit methyltransferase G [Pseudoalteromonas issachenkonii]ATC89919.1 16S rRNA (guanine1207-N2)-methyltransferase [Pseudoalteromonas issachenkonii]MDN3394856.1 methyltransferase [Pseudoalteromonas sp. APC 3215]